jgi:hypothetical protein
MRNAWGQNTNSFKILVEKKKRKRRRPLGRLRRRWEDTVEVDLQRIECETVDGIDSAQVREKWTVLNTATKFTVS